MRNTDPDKMHLSSVDENKGIQPIMRAVELVHDQIQENALKNRDRYLGADELPTIYVTTFTYILGGWKAMVSTSWSDGHYYEVTHNREKHETYVDRYSKDYNVCIPDEAEPPTSERRAISLQEAVSSGSVHITPPPPSPSVDLQAAIARSAQRNARPRYLA